MKAIESIKGMKDIAPSDMPLWQWLEANARTVLTSYGYREMRPTLLERTELFRRSVGEGTDIVEKEMYTFTDRNGESVTLRPECTASCVRAAIQHGWLRGRGQRLWHIGPMFRHENPQKHRYRQFYQLDVEALGYPGPDVDAELILLTARLWDTLGIRDLSLQLNSLGSKDDQRRYRDQLVQYFNAHKDQLDADSLRRLTSNPLRILDSKNPEMREVVSNAPTLIEHLDDESIAHFETLQSTLKRAGISFEVNARLVRGLDYYTRTVFEWVTQDLGAQNAVCGGGRYDGLIEEIGGPPTPAIGFAMGMERIVALLQERVLDTALNIDRGAPHGYLLALGEQAEQAAHPLAETLRNDLPHLRLVVDAAPGRIKGKMKRADRSEARYALILGDEELAQAVISIKDLRGDGAQWSVAQSELKHFLSERLFPSSGNGD